MPAPPLWVALPRTLDLLLGRMTAVREYPVPTDSAARCDMALLDEHAPDPHDWFLWRTGTFVASYEGQADPWPVYLRRCPACRSVEVRKEGWRERIASIRPSRNGMKRTPGAADVLLGWYQG